MPPNFTYTKSANFYVAKGGSDSSYPTTNAQPIDTATLNAQAQQCADKSLSNFTPKATVQAAVNVLRNGAPNILVRSGDYREAISVSLVNARLTAEGICTLRGNGNNSYGTTQGVIADGFRFVDYANVSLGFATSLVNCLVINSAFAGSGGAQNCVFVGCTGGGGTAYNFCVLFNVTFANVPEVKSCDVNGGSSVAMSNSSSGAVSTNNFRGAIAIPVAGNGALGQGSRAGILLSFADHKTEYPAWNAGSFSADPRQNSPARLDFTLRSDSPNLRNGAFSLGGQTLTRAMYHPDNVDTTGQLNPLATANGATYTNLSVQGNDLLIAAGQTFGTILSATVFNNATATALGIVRYVGLLAHDTTQPPASAGYNTAPRVGTQANPNALNDGLAYLVRWTTNPAKPLTDADYTNGGMRTAGEFTAMLYGEVPRIDINGVGNAALGFIPNGSSEVGATWFQLLIRLTNAVS